MATIAMAAAIPLLSPVAVSAAPAAASASEPAAAATPLDFQYGKFVLPNGLTVLVHTDHRNPSVFVGVYYRVGSKDEPKGRTGFAHLFEHLMFQKTANRKGDYFTPLTAAGVTDTNGSTTEDYTEYTQTVPTNAVDLALWMESDRMGYLAGGITQAVLDEQRAVVKNEKRQNPEPAGDLALRRGFYPAGHPYGHTTIGSMADIDAATVGDVRDWFARYYGASNAVLVLSGDIDAATARTKAMAYFADVPRGRRVPSPPLPQGTGTGTGKRDIIHDAVPGAVVTHVWPIASGSARDLTLLPLVAQTMRLPGRVSIQDALVKRDGVALDVSATTDEQLLVSDFSVSIAVKPGVAPERAERAFDAALDRYIADGPEQERLTAIARATDMAVIRSLESNQDVGSAMAIGELRRGDPAFVMRQRQWTAEVTTDELRALARTWLKRPYYQITVLPGTPPAADDGPPPLATLAALPPAQPRARGVDRTRIPEPGPLKTHVALPATTEFTLSNGLHVVVAERHATPIVDAFLQLPTGSRSDPAYGPDAAGQAIALMTAGTAARDEAALARDRERIAMLVGGKAGTATSSFSWSTLSNQTERGFQLAADMLRNPTYPQSRIDRINAEAGARHAAYESAPQNAATTLLAAALWGTNDPRGRIAPPDTRQPLTRQALVAYHASRIVPAGATLLIMGDITPVAARRLAQTYLGDWQAATARPDAARPVDSVARTPVAPAARIILVDAPGSPQSAVAVGERVSPYSRSTDAAETLMDDALAAGFESRINTNLREEKGWTYGFAGQIDDVPTGERLYIAAGSIETDQTAPAMAEIRREIAEYVSTRPITAEELERSRLAAIRAVPASRVSSAAIMAAMIHARDFGLSSEEAQDPAKRLAAVSLDEVRRTARATYRPDALTWVVVGDLAKIEPGIRALGLAPVEIWDVYGRRLR